MIVSVMFSLFPLTLELLSTIFETATPFGGIWLEKTWNNLSWSGGMQDILSF